MTGKEGDQVPKDCELLNLLILNLLGKIAFMNSANQSDKSQRMLERKLIYCFNICDA